MENRRRTERLFDYVVLGALVLIFVAILEVMARANIKPEVLTVLGGALGVDLALIGNAATHLWGAPKKQTESGFSASVTSSAPTPVTPTPKPEGA